MSETEHLPQTPFTKEHLLQAEASVYDFGSEHSLLACIFRKPDLIYQAEREVPSDWLNFPDHRYLYELMIGIKSACENFGWEIRFDHDYMLHIARQFGREYEQRFYQRTEGMEKVRQIERRAAHVDPDRFPMYVEVLRDRAMRVRGIRETVAALRGFADVGRDTRQVVAATTERITGILPVDAGDDEQPMTYEPFPVQFLPSPFREYAQETASLIEQDAGTIALPLLSSMAAAIGATHVARLNASWEEPSILWTALVMPSGSMKTAAIKAGTIGPRQQQAKEIDAYLAAKEQWEAANAGVHASKRTPRPAPIVSRATSCTLEGIRKELANNPRGILLDPDELRSWLGEWNRYAGRSNDGGEESAWLSIWSASGVTIVRRSDDALQIPSPNVSITGSIQPGLLAATFSKGRQDSGLLGRILFAMPPAKDYEFDPDAPDYRSTTEPAVKDAFARLYSLGPADQQGSRMTPHRVTLDEGAKEVLADWTRELNGTANQHDETAKAGLHKLRGTMVRLALIIHLARRATGQTDAEQIDQASATGAAVLARWFMNETLRIYQFMSRDSQQSKASHLREVLGQLGGQATMRELIRKSAAFKGRAGEKAAAELVASRQARWEIASNGPGRRSPRLVLQQPEQPRAAA